MTTAMEYGYVDMDIAATTTLPQRTSTMPTRASRRTWFTSRYGQLREQSEDVVLVENGWEVSPVARIFSIMQRCAATNWDGNHSPAPRREITTAAIDLVLQIAALHLEGLPQPYIGPAAAGGYVFEFQSSTRELSLSLFNDSAAISYLKSEEGEPFEEAEMPFGSPVQLRQLLAWLTTSPA
jgi:hypothetical protein